MIKLMNRWIIFLVILSIVPLIGCANSVKLKFESMGSQITTDGSGTTIYRLAENWTEYDIHYSGGSSASVQGILFDPKNDDKRLVPDGDAWTKVEDQETMNQLLNWNASVFDRKGRLMQIVHPNGQFFGYLYLNIEQNFSGFKVVDDKTIAVFPVRREGPGGKMNF